MTPNNYDRFLKEAGHAASLILEINLKITHIIESGGSPYIDCCDFEVLKMGPFNDESKYIQITIIRETNKKTDVTHNKFALTTKYI